MTFTNDCIRRWHTNNDRPRIIRQAKTSKKVTSIVFFYIQITIEQMVKFWVGRTVRHISTCRQVKDEVDDASKTPAGKWYNGAWVPWHCKHLDQLRVTKEVEAWKLVTSFVQNWTERFQDVFLQIGENSVFFKWAFVFNSQAILTFMNFYLENSSALFNSSITDHSQAAKDAHSIRPSNT